MKFDVVCIAPLMLCSTKGQDIGVRNLKIGSAAKSKSRQHCLGSLAWEGCCFGGVGGPLFGGGGRFSRGLQRAPQVERLSAK